MPMIHHVLFWLKNPGSKSCRDQLVTGLRTLEAISEIQDMHIGVPAPTEERGVVDSTFDVSELMTFASVEDQNAYQVHPVHQAFIRDYGHLWDRVLVYDALEVDPAL